MSAPRRWALDGARVLALTLAVALHALWILSVAQVWPTPEIERRDYAVFVRAGRRALAGELDGVYAPRPGGFPFLHPPPVIALSAPLGLGDERAAYVVLTALAFAALGLSIAALRAIAPRPGEHDVVWLALLASAPWSIALVLGQPAALLLAALLVGLAALERRPLAAGLAWSVLLLKPQLALAPLALAIVRRDRRALSGVLLGGFALAALSLPLGLARWPEWIAALARTGGEVSSAAIPLWKQHTWLAFLRSVAPAPIAWAGWIAALPLGALVLWRLRSERSSLRAGALLALATIALSPYAYFYDALLLLAPGAALWVERERYARRALVTIGALAALTFAWQHAGFFVLQRGPALGGLLVTGWLAAELVLGPRPNDS